jgi:hypothetical protein
LEETLKEKNEMLLQNLLLLLTSNMGKRCANSVERLEDAITSEVEEVMLSKLLKAKKRRCRCIDSCRDTFGAAPQT